MTEARRVQLGRALGYFTFVFHFHMPPMVRPGTKVQTECYNRFNAMRGDRDVVRWLAHFGIHHVINMTPSLMESLDLYRHGGTDTYLEICRKDTKDLTAADKIFMLKQFFPLNPHEEANIVGLSSRRYRELSEKKNSPELFTVQDFRDLQVWHCLSMSGYGLRKGFGEGDAGDPVVCRLIEKDRDFTEEDKAAIIDVQLREISSILPALRQYQETGQISVITSPGFHPITPLVISSEAARFQRGDVLPVYSHPDDARQHYWLARLAYEKFTGRPLAGLWPSEGCVSPDSVELARRVIPTLQYMLTDEAIRKYSAPHIPEWEWQNRFLPWKFAGVNLLFRDKGISDLVGYVVMDTYQSTAQRICGDIVRTITDASQQFTQLGLPDKPVICLVLDGDNFQRSRRDDARDFIYDLCRRLAAVEPGIASITPDEFLALFPRTRQLQTLHTGSWIGAGTYVWTGHVNDSYVAGSKCGADGRGYERIHRAEELLERLQRQIALKYDAGSRQKAYDEINAAAAAGNLFAAYDALSPLAKAIFFVLQAQSSCFRWWYGGTQGEAADLGAFDHQFRSLVASGFSVLSLPVPIELENSLYDPQAYPWVHQLPKISLAS